MNIDQALLDPISVFDTPDDVLASKALTRDQKVRILRRWEYDARELAVAEEENMGGGPPSYLSRVLQALREIGADEDRENVPPTKQGGTPNRRH